MGRIEGNPVHNERYTLAYRCWTNMKQRCDNPRIPGYKNYGGRGITYTANWISYLGFSKDMGQPPTSKHQLERRDNNKGYNKDNCYWATKEQQMFNRRLFHNNKSGVAGIHFDESKQKWITRVYYAKQRLTIYSGLDYFEAICARKAWDNHYGTKPD
jgi:hypothetical protein